MKIVKPIIFSATVVVAIFIAVYSIPQVSSYWDSNSPSLTSDKGNIVCSPAIYRDYRKVSSKVGALNLDFSPIPESVKEKQRVIDGLAEIEPAGDSTQVFVSYIPTGEAFRTQCVSGTCTWEEMEEPMRACLTEHWNDCVHSLVRYEGQNYCLLEVTEGHE